MSQTATLALVELTRFFYWWAVEMPSRIWMQTRSLLITADENLTLGVTFRLWLAIEPLFGDYTWNGRLIGWLFRGFRLIITVAVYAFIFSIGAAVFAFWFVMPVLALIYLFI